MVSDYLTRIVAASTQGKRHKDQGKECQDAAACLRQMDFSIICCADGHGADVHCRSMWGARFAVDVTMETLKTLMYSTNLLQILPDNDWQEQVARSILTQWNERIDEDVTVNPFTQEEQDLLSQYPARVAYGTTLLAAIMTKNRAWFMQIGDGRIITFNSRGDVSEPIPHSTNDSLFQTDSLCDENALEHFHFAFFKRNFKAAFISTDGLQNSFELSKYSDDEGFISQDEQLYRWLSCLQHDCECYPSKWLRRYTKENVEERANCGLGDDVTVAAIVTLDRIQEELRKGRAAARRHELLDKYLTIPKEELLPEDWILLNTPCDENV